MNDEIERVEMTLEQAKAKVGKSQKWKKLLANPLFKELVTEDYLGDDAVRLTMVLKPKAEDNEIANTMLIAKSVLSRYVAGVLEDGRVSYEAILENEALKLELQAEE